MPGPTGLLFHLAYRFDSSSNFVPLTSLFNSAPASGSCRENENTSVIGPLRMTASRGFSDILDNIYRIRSNPEKTGQSNFVKIIMRKTTDNSKGGKITHFLFSSLRSRAGKAGALAVVVAIAAALSCRADDSPMTGPTSSCPVGSYFANWFDRVSAIQAEQPHWVTPLATVTPRLEEELRYDQMWQSVTGGHQTDNYGGNKGLELIPFDPVEVIIGVPAYEFENTNPHRYGWTDETFLLKYRIASGNEDNGNYILTAFMGLSVPSGSEVYTGRHYLYTPTIAGGKGWGKFDFQSTLGLTVPDVAGLRTGPGMSVAWNTALQYHIAKYFWPEVEANYTYWMNGTREGINQLYITPGILLGRLPIYDRVGLTFGAGVQVAVTDKPQLHRNIILTARLPF
jgi:hypothetical protein